MSKKITILQMNDSHSYCEPHFEFYWHGNTEVYRKAGGYARIATVFKNVKKENPAVVLDNGDTIHGTFLAVNSKGEALIPVLNALEVDSMTAHWEFAYGPDHFTKIAEKLDFPVLACNCYYKGSDNLVFPPSCVMERGGVRIGVIGIAATIVDKTMPAHFSKGISFTGGSEELPGYIMYLRETEKVDLVVVVSHLGYPQDLSLAEKVDGIDVLLSGHTHNRIYEAVGNNTIVIQSGCHSSFIGRLDLSVDNGKVQHFRHQLVDINESIEPDPEVDALIHEKVAPHREMLDTVVGTTKTALNRNRVMETTMDNLLLQALKETAGTELAFSNGWRYGAPIPEGQVTMNDVWNIIPTNPPVSTCEISGKELWEMMEENLEHTFSCNPYEQMGGYVKRCLGLNLYFKVENPKGTRIQEFFVSGRRLQKSKTYTACFVTTQGIPEKYGQNRQSLNVAAVDALEAYVRSEKTVSAELQARIVPI